ncbi:MAG: hypothetical protein JWQ88_1502, partial [Rhodoferax sp.]|nr:hypothetical protein [Rhodoferax sp.]
MPMRQPATPRPALTLTVTLARPAHAGNLCAAAHVSSRFTAHVIACFTATLLAGCATAPSPRPTSNVPVAAVAPPAGGLGTAQAYALANRLSWGASRSSVAAAEAEGADGYLAGQLAPHATVLPQAVQQQIDAMTITQRPLESLVLEMAQRNKDSTSAASEDERKAARLAYQQEMNRLAREAAT